jgi:hypothetical protein
VELKAELASVTGIDSVVLGTTQSAQAADYEALGWTRVSESPLTFVNPSPSGLAAEWASGAGMLVVGSDQTSSSHPYNDLFERATAGIIPYSSAWLIRGSSPYVDDYSGDELARCQTLMLVGYRYHDRAKPLILLDSYVRGGGSLYVETGWQYVDPDWNLGSPAPSLLPVGELRWGSLDPTAQVLVDGVATPAWGSMAYGSGGWGASSATQGSLRPGAEALVTVGGRVVAARWQVGRGRVMWSGMNLIAHDAGASSPVEDRFVADQFHWLVGDRPLQAGVAVTWASDDMARVALSPASGSVWVLLKESFAPGWSAELSWPRSQGVVGGTQRVPVIDGELHCVDTHLASVPLGAVLTFTYGPTASIFAAWALSTASFLVLLVWVIRPRWYGATLRPLGSAIVGTGRRALGRAGWSEDD